MGCMYVDDSCQANILWLCYQCWTHKSHMRAWRQIMQMIWCSPIILNNQDLTSWTISMQTTQTLSLHHHYCHFPHLSNLHPWLQACLRNCSQPNIAGKRKCPLMNLKNTSNSLQKILMHVIQFTGGLANKLSSQTCTAWLVTYYVFLVSCQSYTSHFF